MSEYKTLWQRLKTFGMWVCGIYACLLIFDFAYVKIVGQPPQQSLLVVSYSNITSASRLDGCSTVYPCVNNTSQFTKQSSQISYRAISSGAGNWSVDMQWADNSTAGPWTSFGSTAQVDQTSTSGIGYGIGPSSIQKPYHDYIRFVMTGNVIIQNYSGTRQFWWLPSVAAVAFPITATQGGTVGAFVVDRLYATPALGCSAAVSAGITLMMTSSFTSVPTQTMACNTQWMTGGKIRPASGQVVTLSGSVSGELNQHFDTSVGGAGSVLITGRVASIYPNWFGATMDGSHDDSTAAAAALASCPASGCNIAIPSNSNMYLASTGMTINYSTPKYIWISGGGNSSVISCAAGITCVSWTGVTFQQDVGMRDLQISVPTTNSSSIGLLVDAGNTGFGNTRIRFLNMRVGGDGVNKSGIGIKIHNTTLTYFQNLTIQYFGVNLDQTTFSNTILNQCIIAGAGTIGWNINSAGDSQASQCDFEGNGTVGVNLVGSAAQNINISQSHFESNATNEFQIGTGAQLDLNGVSIEGGTALVSSGGVLVADGLNQWDSVTVTNNSTGIAGFVGATFINPLLGPTLAGTGCSSTTQKGVPSLIGAGCSVIWNSTGYSSWSVGGDFIAGGNITATGALGAGSSTSSVTLNGATSCGGSPSILGSSYMRGYPQTVAGILKVGSATVSCSAKFDLPNSSGPQMLWTCGGSDASTGTPMSQLGGSGVGACQITGTVVAGDEVYFWATAW